MIKARMVGSGDPALVGRVAQPMYAVTAVAALGGSLNTLGDRTDTGAGVNAALAMINADTQSHPHRWYRA
jgi:hypothetical protein